MICPECNTNNNYYHTFCYSCGAELPHPKKKVLPADETIQSAPSQIVLNTEPNSKCTESSAFRKPLLYIGLSILGVSLVVLLMTILSNVGAKQKLAYVPTPLPATASPAPTQQLVEKAMLRILEPESLTFETDQESYIIKIVSASKAKVKMNGLDIASDREGIWTKEVPLNLGENKFEIEAQCKGFLTASETVTINRAAAPPKLILSDEYPTETHQSTLTITGTTEPNALLSTSLPAVDEPLIDAQGNFELIVQLPVIPGEYNMTVKSVANGKETSLTQKVTRLWNEEEYSEAAEKVSYSDLVDNPQDWEGRVLDIKGKVYSIESTTDGTTVFTFLLDGERSDKILVEYDGETKIYRGASRRLYCHLKEKKEDLIVVSARMAFRSGS